ncbi:MAG: ABC transporter permease [Planctomycetaceae bacterium]|nr:ABC transporter permease [Planctomycetaceae bacterium]
MQKTTAISGRFEDSPITIRGVVDELVLIMILIAMIILFGALNKNFLSMNNMLNILRQISIYGIMAAGMTVVLLCGHIDISVGSVVAFSGVVTAYCVQAGTGMFTATVAAILVAMGIGLFNGLITVRFALPSMLVTLGTQQAVRGLGYVITNGRPVYGMPEWFGDLGGGYFLGIPRPVIILVAVAIVSIVYLKYTRFGRDIYAVGGNKEAARLCGIHSKRVIVSALVICAGCAGLSGAIWAARLTSGQPTVGMGYEMQVIAAAVIGGTSLNGGQGNIARSFLGALILGVLYNGLNLVGVSPYWQLVATGLIIILAIVLDSIRSLGGRS